MHLKVFNLVLMQYVGNTKSGITQDASQLAAVQKTWFVSQCGGLRNILFTTCHYSLEHLSVLRDSILKQKPNSHIIRVGNHLRARLMGMNGQKQPERIRRRKSPEKWRQDGLKHTDLFIVPLGLLSAPKFNSQNYWKDQN